jgi:hypothetical protein
VTHNLSENDSKLNFTADEGLQGILTLFNLMPDPAVIYQRTDDKILAANNALFLLTNLGEQEFIHQSLTTLLPNISDTDPISGHDKKALLRHKKQPPIPVIVRIFPLTTSDDNLVIVLKPDEGQLITKSKAAEQLTAIDRLIHLFNKPTTCNMILF